MKVLIAGANGHTGRLIVQYLIERGYEAYAMVRSEHQGPELEDLGAKIVLADLEKELDHAVEGKDTVIFAAGSGSKTGPEKTIDVDQNGAIRLIDAAKKHGVGHFVMLSAINADRPAEGSEKLAHYLKAKGVADDYLRESGLPFTIVRPGGLTHEAPTGKVKIAAALDRGVITRDDVANVIVTSLEEEKARNKSFDLLQGDIPVAEALKSL